MPSPTIEFQFDIFQQQCDLIDEIKQLAQKGHDIFALISDKLSVLPQELESVANFKTLLTKDHSLFKQRIDEVQIKLTSPTIENKVIEPIDPNKGNFL